MHDKKQAILDILEQLFDSWDLARGIHTLVKSEFADDAFIDGLLEIVYYSLKKVQDEGKQKMLKSVAKKLRNIKNNEAKEKEETLQEVSGLLTHI